MSKNVQNVDRSSFDMIIERTSIDHIVIVILSVIVTEFDRELTISAMFDYKIDTIIRNIMVRHSYLVVKARKNHVSCKTDALKLIFLLFSLK